MARKRETQLQPYPVKRIDDFSSGQNTAHPATIPDNALAVATNVMYTPEGKVVPRVPAQKRFSADFDANPVIGMSAYYKSDGTTRLVMAAGTSLYADEPHIIFNYDAQADWKQTGVYTNLDADSSPGDLKLYNPAAPTFTRNSAAYKSDGTQVAADQPRFEKVLF